MRNLSVIELENILGGCIPPTSPNPLEELKKDPTKEPILPDWKDLTIWH